MGPDVIHTSARLCPACGAELLSGASRCWLCHADVEPAADGEGRFSGPGTPGQTALSEPAGGFSLASLMMFVTLAAVVMGVSSIAPGVGIPLGIVLLVVWLRTTLVAKHRRAHGQVVTREEKLHLFLASFGATLAMLTVTCIAGCGAFIAACFACMGTWAALGGDTIGVELIAWTVFGLVALAIGVPVLRWIAKIIRRRWRRDVGEPEE